MNFTKEQLEKAKEAKSAEELLALAKENNIEMTAEEAAKNYAELHKSGELSDDELDNVSGGGCQATKTVYATSRCFNFQDKNGDTYQSLIDKGRYDYMACARCIYVEKYIDYDNQSVYYTCDDYS